jgi:8-oxo-dGTP pyrophosphatase MutT (NUDIX family)
MEKPVNLANRASGVALIHKGLVLLAKRIEGPGHSLGGYWSVFAGTVDKNENHMACAVRELWEESRIKIHISQLKFIKIIKSSSMEFAFYVCEVDKFLTPTLNFEHTEYGWFDIEGLKSFPEKIDQEIVDCLFLHHNQKGLD